MKITDRLVGDHLTFRKLIKVLDSIADAPPAQRELKRLIRDVELFKDHLTLHAWAEDVFYYPAIREKITDAPKPLTETYMNHLDDEHKTVDGYLDRLELEVKATPPARTWPQTYSLFSKGLLSHMKKEEEELFPLSEKMLGAAKLEDLSKQLESHRSDAPKVRLHTQLN